MKAVNMEPGVVSKANESGAIVVACPWRCSNCSYKFTDEAGELMYNGTSRVILLNDVNEKQTMRCTPSDSSMSMPIVVQPMVYRKYFLTILLISTRFNFDDLQLHKFVNDHDWLFLYTHTFH